MTPLQRLEIAILTLKAHMEDTREMTSNRREAAIAGATEVLVEAALEALPSIEIANMRNKAARRQEVAA